MYQKKRVAAYARVSTDMADQLHYTCDHLHTLHSLGLNFYTAEQVMQVLNFTEDEKQWVALTAMNIEQYLITEPEGG